MTIKKVTTYLEKLYPLKNSEDWDACGLIFGHNRKRISKVMIALDLTTEVFNEALENDIELIVVHHPFIFNKENISEEVEFYKYKEALIKRIENTGMGVYVMHTNFDISKQGMKQATIDLLALDPSFEKLDYGVVLKNETNLSDLKNMIIDKYGFTQYITNAHSEHKISKIAVLPGTGTVKDMLKSQEYGVDLIISADIKWSTWVLLKERKIFALQISHQMEKVMIQKVKEDLIKLGGIDVSTHIERIIK